MSDIQTAADAEALLKSHKATCRGKLGSCKRKMVRTGEFDPSVQQRGDKVQVKPEGVFNEMSFWSRLCDG